ncbi:MAG: polyprenyl synthetase family protein [Bacteroidaceae bacterium]|nr:polyprenyl synthetase family protein [Bacteroidaceae bacterium]
MLETIQRPIQDDLKRYAECFRCALVTDNTLLSAALHHVGQRQGKMMRPTLVLLCALEAGQVSDAALHAAVGLELLHTASLLHDDVLDESDMRRGQPSVNALWGDKAAVLVGDYLTSKALQEVTISGNTRLMERTGWLGQQLADGELEQMDITSDRDFSEARYYSVIAKKTASLFSTAAFAGALLGGGSDKTVEALEHVGHLIGLCFQLRDDLLDFDSSKQTGKPKFTDLREGKVTLPLIYALNTSNDEAMQQLALKARKGEATNDECLSLTRFAISRGGADYAEAEMQRLRTEVFNITQQLHNTDIANSLQTYIDYVIKRDK